MVAFNQPARLISDELRSKVCDQLVIGLVILKREVAQAAIRS
jgi:hypothetical protein